MKKAYESPIAEKIAFNYRDQVVAASSGNIDTEDNGNPQFGEITQEQWGSNGCKLHALEAWGLGICDLA